MNKISSKIAIIVSVVAITLLAFGLRIYAAERLNIDDDEITYLSTSLKYTNYIREGKYHWLAWETTNYEHPSFYKIIYGVSLLTEPPLDKIRMSNFLHGAPIAQVKLAPYGLTERYVSVVFGSLAAMVLAIVNPLAGLFLAINTLGIKYTSEIYLEALPMLSSLLCALAYLKYYQTVLEHPTQKKKIFLWLGASALCLGITAASKYVYCTVAVAIVMHWLIGVIRKRIPVQHLYYLLVWAFVSVFMFFVFDPYLWPHPFARLLQTVGFNLNYSKTKYVADAGFPFWQPIIWLWNPFANYKVASSADFLIHLDPLIFILALIGLPRAFKRNGLFLIWFVVGLSFLLIWQTKWQQYPSIILVPYCFMASMGVMTLYDFGKKKITQSHYFKSHFPAQKSL